MTRSIPVEPINHFHNPTSISLASNQTIPATSRYIVRVTPTNTGFTLVGRAGMSNLIQNEGAFSMDVSPVGASGDITLSPGYEIRLTWDSLQSHHEVQITQSGSLDSAMSSSSTNAVKNNVIKSYVDATVASGGQTYVYYLTGTGVAATDNANLATAVTYMNTAGNVHLHIKGNLHVNSTHIITKSCRVTCVDGGIITFYSGAQIRFGTAPTVGTTAFTATSNRFRSTITSPNLALTEGSFYAIKADDELATPYSSHLAGWTHHAMELHRVEASLGSNQYKFAEQYVDNFTTNPTIFEVPMIRGVILENIRYTYVGGSTPSSTPAWSFYGCHGLRIINPHGIYPVPGGWWFRYCYDVVIEDPIIDAKYAPMAATADANYGYNFIVGLCTRFKLRGGTIGMCRHGITTTNEITGTNQRWGTSLLCSVKGMDFTANRGTSDNTICLDTHAEGYGWVFDDCNFHGYDGSISNGILVQNRARNTIVKNCTYDGQATNSSSGGYGIYNLAPDMMAIGNTFRRCTHGIRQIAATNINCDTAKIINNHFEQCFGPAIMSTTGQGTLIDGNTFINCGYVSGFSIIELQADTDPVITRNMMMKDANTYAVKYTPATVGADFKFIGNVATGYGTSIFDTTTTKGADLNTAWALATRNWID